MRIARLRGVRQQNRHRGTCLDFDREFEEAREWIAESAYVVVDYGMVSEGTDERDSAVAYDALPCARREVSLRWGKHKSLMSSMLLKHACRLEQR